MSDYQPTPPAATPYATGPVAGKSPVLSILSLVFGIVGVLGSFILGLGFFPGVAAIVLAVLGRRKEPAAKGLWLTGLITGIVAVVIGALFLAILIAAIAVGAAHSASTAG